MAELTEAGCVGFSQAEASVRDTLVLQRALAVRLDLRLRGLAAPQRPWLGNGVAARAAGHAPGPVGRAGHRRDHRARHAVRAGARYQGARAPVPPQQRRRRRPGARRQGRGPAGELRRERQQPAPHRRRHRLLQRRDARHAAAAPAARDRDALRAGAGRRHHRRAGQRPHAGRRGRQEPALRRGRAGRHRAGAAALGWRSSGAPTAACRWRRRSPP